MMKHYLLLLFLVGCLFASSKATSQQVCGYTALDGHNVFLRYFPGIKAGEDFIDYGNGEDGVCLQRAECLETYETKVESCTDYKVDCINRHTFTSLFPTCCVKC
ncbi:uncharacterized protein LOC129238821 [Anastrepha obliqua]|uniref:uncharacterized protein LOC129238821 n=1 Tax=Anastrepha obliqua TaxID=95512 RepID=UPI00240927CD|nr:uncharacterized protein LOC129238821 [Anastrepha obliqua]